MAFRGALVNRTTNFTGLTFPVFMQWDNIIEDTDGLFGVGGSLTRFTIPASGVAYVSFIASIRAPDRPATIATTTSAVETPDSMAALMSVWSK